MAKRKTHEEFVDEMKFKYPHIEILGNYVNGRTKIRCRCIIHDYEWATTPESLLHSKNGCPKCSKKYRRTPQEFEQEINSINPNIELLSEFVNTETKILCKCKIDGHEWFALPWNLLNGSNCPKCTNQAKIDFIEEFNKLDSSISMLGEYKNVNTRILCKCQECEHEWYAIPRNLLNGSNCPKCTAIKTGIKNRKTHEEFVKQVNEKNPNIKILGQYTKNKCNIRCQCKICNYEWDAYPPDIVGKNPHGCPKCGNAIRKTQEEFITELHNYNPDVEVLGEYVNNKTKFLCKCKNCGYEWIDHPNNLLRNDRHSGCVNCREGNKSCGEEKINIYLNNKDIPHEMYKTFDELTGLGGGLLSYDFYLPTYNLLIEYQGVQHEKAIKYFGGEKKFKGQQEHDRRKREYAKENNISLLEIWYWDFDRIEEILDEYLKL